MMIESYRFCLLEATDHGVYPKGRWYMRFERLRHLSAERNIGRQVADDPGLLLQRRNKAEFSQECLSRTGWHGNNSIF